MMKISTNVPRYSTASPAAGSLPHRTGREERLLSGLLLFNGIGAVGGGIAILTGDIGLPLRLLEGTPFSTYTIPGWILLLAVGGSSMAASVVVWRQTRLASEAAMAAGAVLLGWIMTEFVMIPEAWMPQLIYFFLSLAIIGFGMRLHRLKSVTV